MKIFVTGVNGQLGHDVINEIKSRGYECIGTDISPEYLNPSDYSSDKKNEDYIQLDITDANAVNNIIKTIKPDVVIHCAAWTAVDAAEEDTNKNAVRKINYEGTKNVAEACRLIDSKMVYISTDYVFGGDGDEPWEPDCSDYNPLNFYGQTKLEGEKAVSGILDKYFIVRISWVFGLNGNNFIKTMLKVGRTNNKVKVVNDQIGTPTYTIDLAKLLADMVETEKYGYYHATNDGDYISWYDFAVEVFKQTGITVNVIPVTSAEYGFSKARRPLNSRMDKRKLKENGFNLLPDWKNAVSRCLKEMGEI